MNKSKLDQLSQISVDIPVQSKIYKIGELFCGAGGFALGASMARYNNHILRHVWANDNNAGV